MTRPVAGDLWRYDYLWRWQHDGGETEGRKARPVALVAVIEESPGTTKLFILPITSAPPSPSRLAMEVPQIERRRAGLDDIPLWIMLDEYNHDRLETSFYFDPKARIGAFSSAFHKRALQAFVIAAREKRVKRVPRND
jgi:hypothetical protein